METVAHKSLRDYAVPTACAALCVMMILYSDVCMNAAREAFNVWLNSVMPALLPFFVCASVMMSCSGKVNPITMFLAAALSGAPSGPIMTNSVYGGYTAGIRYSVICAATCMFSPMFIVGTVAGSMEGNITFALPVAIGHYGASLAVFLSAAIRKRTEHDGTNALTRTPLTAALPNAIASGVASVARVCGTIIFFMVVSSVINATGVIDKALSSLNLNDAHVVKALLIGFLEMTNGCKLLSEASVAYPLKCALYSFIITSGGACVMAQGRAFAEFRVRDYITAKIITAVVAGAISYIAAMVVGGSAAAVSSSTDIVLAYAGRNALTALWCFLASVLGISLVYLVSVCFAAGYRRKADDM